MGARTGQQFLEGLKDGRRVYVDGDLVRDVTSYAPFRGVLQELARLYDCQHSPEYKDILTYPSPTTGQPVSYSFLPASTWDEIERRVRAERTRCELVWGVMGRPPGFVSAFMTDFALLRGLLGRNDRRFGDNIWNYYELCRENDFSLADALNDPQIDRSKGAPDQETVRIVKETDAGLVIDGARGLATLGPFAHEILIGSFRPRAAGEEEYAVLFALPVATSGVKLICREPYDRGRSRFDRPLTGRFDQVDVLAVFDHVLVPWERVFCARDLSVHNSLLPSLPGFIILHSVIRAVVGLRFMAGLANLVARATGKVRLPRYQEVLGDLAADIELGEAMIVAGAHQAMNNAARLLGGERAATLSTPHGGSRLVPGGPAWESSPGAKAHSAGTEAAFVPGGPAFRGVSSGVAAVQMFFPYAYSKAVEAIRMMGTSGLVMTPTERDFANSELAEILPRYFKGPDMPATERVRIMKLAWDAIASDFGSRNYMYEWFFTGEPPTARTVYFHSPITAECTAMVRDLLDALAK